MAKLYAIESPVLEMGRIVKNRLSALRVKSDPKPDFDHLNTSRPSKRSSWNLLCRDIT